MAPSARPRQVARLLSAVAVTLVVGTIAFRETLHEGWFQSFYRAVVTVTLTGLDSIPSNDSTRIVSLVLVVAGVTIIAYAGAVIFESIAGGVFTGALAERRRERTIEHLHDHFIICGYGRVGLSARSERPELTIVARASGADAERKLALAGADRVVLPYTTAGRVMANLVLKPQVTAFLDAVTTAAGPDLFSPRETVAG